MTSTVDLDMCWAPVPVRWRHVGAGAITVGRDGSLIPIVAVRRRGSTTEVQLTDGQLVTVDHDDIVSVLVPIPERDAAELFIDELGARLAGTLGGEA